MSGGEKKTLSLIEECVCKEKIVIGGVLVLAPKRRC